MIQIAGANEIRFENCTVFIYQIYLQLESESTLNENREIYYAL